MSRGQFKTPRRDNSFHIVVLHKEFEKRLAQNPKYSMRLFARELGNIDNSVLSRVMGGVRYLSPRVASRIIDSLKLSKKDAKLFMESVMNTDSLSDRGVKSIELKMRRGEVFEANESAHPVGIISGPIRVEDSLGLSPEEVAKKEKIHKARHMIDRAYERDYSNKRIIITTAVQGADVDKNFLQAIETYCKDRDAELVILTIRAHTKALSEVEYPIDPILVDGYQENVCKSIILNKHLSALDIDIKPQTPDPLAGLQELGAERGRSYIFAHTTQRMKTYPNGLKTLPRLQWCTGSLTKPLYRDNKQGLMGDLRHEMGALVVEITDGDTFLVRNVQADSKGSFIDIAGDGAACRYNADGTIDRGVTVKALVRGDEHGGPEAYGDPIANDALAEVAKKLKPEKVVLHDLHDSASISHHREGNILATLSVRDTINTLEKELNVTRKHLETVKSQLPKGGELVVVTSNHNDHLHQYLNAPMRWATDKVNYKKALELANVYHNQGVDPLQYAVDPDGDLATWVGLNDGMLIEGVQVGSHGHRGTNGSRGSVKSDLVSFGKSVSGHSHSPEYLRGASRVGTSSLLRLDYNDGPSSWAHAAELIFEKGLRQMFFIINGVWRMEQPQKPAKKKSKKTK